MNILLIGSGGREHTIAKSLSKSKKLKNLYCIPGNAGIEEVATCYNKDTSNKKEILEFCIKNEVELVFIGPEIPLVEGLADYLNQNNIFAFGLFFWHYSVVNYRLSRSFIIIDTFLTNLL